MRITFPHINRSLDDLIRDFAATKTRITDQAAGSSQVVVRGEVNVVLASFGQRTRGR